MSKTKRSKRSEQPSAVLRAVMARDTAALQAALQAGGAVDARDSDGRTPLHQAAIEGDVRVAETLLKAGAEVSATDAQGWTPLHFAAQEYRVDVAKILLLHGAAVDAVDKNGNTPLWRAVFASGGRSDMVIALRNSGADRNRKNAHGVSPFDLARTIANQDIGKWLE